MSIYEEIEIEDMKYDPEELVYTYPCPCGDRFRITLEELWDGEDIAKCPSCTLRILVIYDECDLPPLPESDEDDDDDGNDQGAKAVDKAKKHQRGDVQQLTSKVENVSIQ